jgi:hypothetical protein
MSSNEQLKPNQKQEYCQPLLVKHGLLTDVTQKSGDKNKDGKETDKVMDKGVFIEEKFDRDAKGETDNKREDETNKRNEELEESFKQQREKAERDANKGGIEF